MVLLFAKAQESIGFNENDFDRCSKARGVWRVVFLDFGQKKTLSKFDRDKTKNKHYEQTLIFRRVREEKVPRKIFGGLNKKQKL